MTVLPITIEWIPPWEGPLAEDHELQKKAAERLVQYLNQGRVWVGGVPARVEAEVDNIERSMSKGVTHSVKLRFDLQFDVKVRA